MNSVIFERIPLTGTSPWEIRLSAGARQGSRGPAGNGKAFLYEKKIARIAKPVQFMQGKTMLIGPMPHLRMRHFLLCAAGKEAEHGESIGAVP